ncbi:MAG: RNA polymerase sigma factor [Bacteroidetes bacterium]|nr:RNA polymerase sigma factor [Bacteroidota bacterium]
MIDFNMDDFRSGDERTWKDTYDKIKDRMRLISSRILPRHDSHVIEDILQHAFHEVWNKREKFESPTHVANTLYKIVRDKSINYLKRNKTIQTTDPQSLGYPFAEGETFSENETIALEVDHQRLMQQVKAELPNLRRIQREVFQLYWFENLSLAEIAIQKKISENAVRMHEYRARKKLKKLLEDRGFSPYFFSFLPLLIFFSKIS